jgi:hypothetical protein
VFAVGPDDLRDRRAFSFEASEVERVAVKRSGGEVLLEKRDQQWFLATDGERAADSVRVREFLGALADTRAQKFLPSGTKLREPESVEIVWGKGELSRTETVYVEPAEGDVVRARRGENGAVLELPSAVARELASPAMRFWDRRVLTFKADTLTRLSITRDGVTESATRSIEGWKLEGGGEVNAGIADSMKWALADLAVDAFVEGTPQTDARAYGLDIPFIRVEVDTKPGERGAEARHVVLLVGRLEDEAAQTKRRFGALEGGDAIFMLGEHVVAKFEKSMKKRSRTEAD